MFAVADRTWMWIAAVCYLAGFALGSAALLRERRHSHRIMYALIAIGFALQTIGLYHRGQSVRGCPLGNMFELFQFTAWSAISLYLVVGATFRLSLLGYFTSCLSATLTTISLAIPAWDAVRRADVFGGNPWIEFHAALALFSYGVFGLLALTSIMYLLQVFSLKRHHLRGLFSFLPPVVDLDHINRRLLVAGVVLMTAALAVGCAYWVQDFARVPLAKLILTSCVWASYTAALVLRLRGRFVAKRLAWACIAFYAAALVSLPFINSIGKTLPVASTVIRQQK